MTVSGANVTASTIVLSTSGGSMGGGGGGSVTTYAVKVNAGAGGSASSDRATAAKGATVKITVTPDEGYAIKDIKAVDADGKEVTLSTSGSAYTFSMPASAVTVTVSFESTTGGGAGHDCPSKPYTDVDISLWYHQYIDFVLENGIMVGTSNTTFEPQTKVSRAMLVQVLYNIEGKPAVSGGSSFSDVTDVDWFYDAVTWASSNGIVLGYDESTFGPNDSVTREQMVAILYRYASYKGYDTSATGSLNAFTDAGSVSGYALAAMQWAVGSNLMQGRTDTELAPKGTATRAEVATIIMRYCEAYDIF